MQGETSVLAFYLPCFIHPWIYSPMDLLSHGGVSEVKVILLWDTQLRKNIYLKIEFFLGFFFSTVCGRKSDLIRVIFQSMYD